MQLKEIILALNELAPPSLQEDYDNSGLITGHAEMNVTGALLSLDCTEAVVNEAIQLGLNLIIAHHPIIFRGLKSITGRNYVERTVIKAIKHDVAIYAIHTNLDNVRQGVNAAIAGRLGLQDLRILAPLKGKWSKLAVFVPHANAEAVRNAMFEAGAGHVGQYDACSFNTEGTGTFRAGQGTHPHVGDIGKLHSEAETRIEVVVPEWKLSAVTRAMMATHPYEEVAYDVFGLRNENASIGSGMLGLLPAPVDPVDFLEMVKEKFNVKVIRHTALCKPAIQSVALCGGSGSFLLPAAIGAGADVFISADFKYHEFFDADNQIIIADIGHFESEQFTPSLIADWLRGKFNTFATHLSTVVTNPVHYL
ncbi:MAG: Nif3-like dinuclear metal center hexameric protein [Flavobacteriales bacterium]|nr:Nif3-like dinuclear metal center hexameric protein [Flavobacteriales bacterium]